MEYVILIGALIIFVGLIVLLFRWVIGMNKRKVILHTAFAEKHGFSIETSKYLTAKLNTMVGQKDGINITIDERMVGSGKNQHVVTTLTLTPTSFDFDFKIGKEHIFSKMGKGLGFKDVEIGDEKFDKRFLLKSKDPDKLKMLVDYNIQADLKAIDADLKASIYGNGNIMTYALSQPMMKQKQLDSFEKVMELMLKLVTKKNGRRETTNY
ncbi:MAG: hypothetical protein BM555_05295 [Crocinitomix sp. MedPE-SWsnd]|jgi:hypothetical protein|nr:MAG: hypothetical protein BM555_05295 [Crocinitomix sp. MedPE-SWsnd]